MHYMNKGLTNAINENIINNNQGYIINLKVEKIYNKILKDNDIYDYEIKYLNTLYSAIKPKENVDLRRIILFYSKYCPNESLNWIDVSNITNMHVLFAYTRFNGDISKWNVSNVKNMENMFEHSNFNNDISNWDVSNVENMFGMFSNANFNNDISNWNVSKVRNFAAMFSRNFYFNQNISNWNLLKAETVTHMFYESNFNQDISNWDLSTVLYNRDMFKGCPIKEEYKPKL